jgi:hypothetical protein
MRSWLVFFIVGGEKKRVHGMGHVFGFHNSEIEVPTFSDFVHSIGILLHHDWKFNNGNRQQMSLKRYVFWHCKSPSLTAWLWLFKSQARPKPTPGQHFGLALAWPILAWPGWLFGFGPGHANH